MHMLMITLVAFTNGFDDVFKLFMVPPIMTFPL